MADMAEDYAALRWESKVRRSSNRNASTQILEEAGIKFTSHNEGAHLIVTGTIDFWPGTGKWKHRYVPEAGRGVRSLIDYLRRS